VQAAAMGGGAFLQVAYGPEDVVAYAWKPREFADMARRMESADYLAQVVEEQEANKDEAEKWKAVVSRAEKEALIARRDRRVADWLRENGVRTLLRQQPN